MDKSPLEFVLYVLAFAIFQPILMGIVQALGVLVEAGIEAIKRRWRSRKETPAP